MIAIRREIAEVESGAADPAENVLKHAPHTVATVSASPLAPVPLHPCVQNA